MKSTSYPYFFIFLWVSVNSAIAQLYFPPTSTDAWETISPSELGWCENKLDSLSTFLETTNTKAFILLKEGKIVLEEYFNGHSQDENWYWASAGKSLKAFAVGIAQQENLLNMYDSTSDYLGPGWTSCTPPQEEAISIYHQLSMSSGLNDNVDNANCTSSECLTYLSEAGSRWAYHNAPYQLLDQVLENATNQPLNVYITQKIKTPTGMNGAYLPVEDGNVYFSTPRSMARFGLLMLANGNWNGNQLLNDTTYFSEMVNTSQDLNLSYGYLWWLNGKSSFMIPQSQIVFNGSLFPAAPQDMYSALGKNGQFINVIPSENMVWIRMGEAPDSSLVPFTLNNEIWEYINELDCENFSMESPTSNLKNTYVYPNPSQHTLYIHHSGDEKLSYQLSNAQGQLIEKGIYLNGISISSLASGVYFIQIASESAVQVVRWIKE